MKPEDFEDDVPTWVRALTRIFIPADRKRRFESLSVNDAGHGYDVFGAHREGAAIGHLFTDWMYEHWFRVDSRGAENIPASGPVVVAANHSGTLPFDAMMLYADLLRKTDPPRLPRAVADRFVAALPWVNLFFARAGVVGGTRQNVERLLEQGELILVHPEGVPGISKRFVDRYQLQPWRVGHVELAMRWGAAVVPTAIVGAEEQMPQLARVPIRLFGAPFVPIPATPFPLPVRYRIRYGTPVRFDVPPGASDDPDCVRRGAAQIALAVQRLIDETLEEREGIFR